MRIRLALLSIFLLLGSTLFAFAQMRHGHRPVSNMDQTENLAPITGVVRTADGHAVPNAKVEIHDMNTGATVASAYTLANGVFISPGLSPGRYEIVAYSGLSEVRERINTSFSADAVILRLPTNRMDSGAQQPTVSVNQLKVSGKAAKELETARDEIARGKLQEARGHINAALATYPNFADALTLRGIISLQERNFTEALPDFEKAIAADPTAALPYVALGAAYNGLGQYDNALLVLQRATAMAPNFWQGYFETARAQLAKGGFEAALAQVSKAEQLAPKDFSSLHLVKAYSLLGLKQYAEAVPEFEQYLSRESESPDAAQARRTLEQLRTFLAASVPNH
ncbi:MAG: tetratricopeptide repeat protein [Terriglobales bacterium]